MIILITIETHTIKFPICYYDITQKATIKNIFFFKYNNMYFYFKTKTTKKLNFNIAKKGRNQIGF